MRRRSGYGWLEFVLGILLVILGIWVFADPDLALTGMVYAYGAVALIMGVADIILYIRVERFTGFGPIISLVSGILSVMSGVMLLVYPGIGVLALTLLFPIWFIAHCISRLTHLNHIRMTAGDGMYYITLIITVIGLILGFLMFLSPLFTITAIRCFAGVYLILLGIDSICIAVSRMGMRR